MSNWKEYKLGDVCKKIGSGATPRGGGDTYHDSGEYALIRSQNVLDFVFSMQGLAYINDEQASKLKNVELERNDILLNITGDSVARVCQVPSGLLPARVNQHVAIIRPDNKFLNHEFLKYYLLNPKFKEYMLMLSSSGATRNAITKGMIENFVIQAPDIHTQNSIAEILSSLDDKIELNNQINQELEALAQALFKQWFIDFEFPNEKGQPYKSSGGEMVGSEFGEIPKGWNNKYLNETAVCFDSKRIPLSSMEREKRKGHYPYYGAASLMDYIDDFLFDGVYVLMGEDGSVTDTKGYPVLQYVSGKIWVNNHAHVLQGKLISTELILCLLRNTNISHLVTGAVQPKLNQGNMNKVSIPLPNDLSTIKHVEDSLSSLFALVRENTNENTSLSKLRDELLPKLITGELEVSDIKIK